VGESRGHSGQDCNGRRISKRRRRIRDTEEREYLPRYYTRTLEVLFIILRHYLILGGSR
jgi:hypothetical protein